MIDLTPLDVRNKRGDFKKQMRGYDPQEVDVFLEIAAERLEELVRENIVLRERSETLEQQVGAQTGREKAVQEALVTAQELRADIQSQARREADHIVRESETEARQLAAEAEANVRNLLQDAERRLALGRDALEEMERRRTRFLKAFRQLLERELDVVDVADQRAPLEDRPIDLDLGGGRFSKERAHEDSEEPRRDPEQAVTLALDSDHAHDSGASDDSDGSDSDASDSEASDDSDGSDSDASDSDASDGSDSDASDVDDSVSDDSDPEASDASDSDDSASDDSDGSASDDSDADDSVASDSDGSHSDVLRFGRFRRWGRSDSDDSADSDDDDRA